MVYQRFPTYKQVLVNSMKTTQNYEKFKILIIRNFTLEKIFDSYLNYFLSFSFLNAEVTYGQFDEINDNIVEFNEYNYIILWVRIDDIFNNVRINEDQKFEHIQSVVEKMKKITQSSDCNVIVIKFDPLYYSATSNSDILDLTSLYHKVYQIINFTEDFKNTYLIDTNILFVRHGLKQLINSANLQRWDMPYSNFAFCEFANLIASFIVAHKNKTKKCLILDCDNVLWGDVAEEVGINNIILSDIVLGAKFQQFQKSVFDVYSRGIILAICSKNNLNTVVNVFEEHPSMILKKSDFAVIIANWNDKATNLKSIAKSLNISLSSMVFIDDQDFEIQWIESQLPEVTVIQFSKDEPECVSRLLQTTSLFSSLYITKEDVERSKIYQIKAKEDELIQEAGSYDKYVQTLNIESDIKEATLFDVDRIAQLIQRTNQFNINRIRYSKEELMSFMQLDDYSVQIVTYKDKYFDYGIVGGIILREDNNDLRIISYFLSCKVLKRNLEYKMLDFCKNILQQKKSDSLSAHHVIYDENQLAVDFFNKAGFVKRSNDIYYLIG